MGNDAQSVSLLVKESLGAYSAARACLVFLPTRPSAVRPARFWKAMTASTPRWRWRARKPFNFQSKTSDMCGGFRAISQEIASLHERTAGRKAKPFDQRERAILAKVATPLWRSRFTDTFPLPEKLPTPDRPPPPGGGRFCRGAAADHPQNPPCGCPGRSGCCPPESESAASPPDPR